MRSLFGDSKYSMVLTIGLIVIVIAIFGLLGYFGYSIYQKYYGAKQVGQAITEFENQFDPVYKEDTGEEDTGAILDPYGDTTVTANQSGKRAQLGGYDILGTIEIPKTKVKYPILAEVTTKSLKLAVAKLYGPNLNQPGNVVIAGHNYRDGSFFGRNAQLKNGDKIYITDETGTRVEYVIYNVYTAPENDSSYFVRDTKGLREISLTTCTDDSKARTIIWARENI